MAESLSDEIQQIPEFVTVRERRATLEGGHDIAAQLREKGLGMNEAGVLSQYIYHTEVPLEECMGNAKILDAGARDGDFKKALKKLGSTADITSLDIKSDPGVDVVSDIRSMSMFKDGNFDMVVANWAIPTDIMPYDDPSLIADEIKEMYRVTKKGGTLFFVPIKMFTAGLRHDKSEGVWRKNYENVIKELEMIHKENPSAKIEIIRKYTNTYAQIKPGPDIHDQDYTEILVIHK